jgi:hypothetical protein
MNNLPFGFKRHPTYPELAANENGDIIRWNMKYNTIPRWTKVIGSNNGTGYLQLRTPNNGPMVCAHHMVFECFYGVRAWSNRLGSGITINHINGDNRDNRLCNLEAITSCENIRLANCKHGLPKHITPNRNKFQIRVSVKGKLYSGGNFPTVADAQATLPSFYKRIGYIP